MKGRSGVIISVQEAQHNPPPNPLPLQHNLHTSCVPERPDPVKVEVRLGEEGQGPVAAQAEEVQGERDALAGEGLAHAWLLLVGFGFAGGWVGWSGSW